MKQSTILIIVALLLAALVVPVVSAAPVEYPSDYYTIKNLADVWYNSPWINFNNSYYSSDGSANIATIGSFLELRRQSILMEKQNELLAEQNELLKKIAENLNPKLQYNRTNPMYDYSNITWGMGRAA